MKSKSILLAVLTLLLCVIQIGKALADENLVKHKSYEGLPDNENDGINELLTYRNIDNSVISLVPGAHGYALYLQYHSKIDPSLVGVALNGVDISELFVPAQGNSDYVALPLKEGVNYLELRGAEMIFDDSGMTPQWDYDNFVIVKPRLEGVLEFSTNGSDLQL